MADGRLLLEYSKSARAACPLCGFAIGKGLVRVGRETKVNTWTQVKWHHASCFSEHHPEVDFVQMSGFLSLKVTDQEILRGTKAEMQSDKPIVTANPLSLHATDAVEEVIFTNESTIDRFTKQRSKAIDSKLGRLKGFMEAVKLPVQVFIACGKSGSTDLFRKPATGMWHLMEHHLNDGISVDMDASVYVGDAAGRKKDHSDADIAFAKALGLKFLLPEEVFLSDAHILTEQPQKEDADLQTEEGGQTGASRLVQSSGESTANVDKEDSTLPPTFYCLR